MDTDTCKFVSAQLRVERELEYRKWMREIPYLKFSTSWDVQIIPPFGGAIVRFCVRNKRGREVSVYLDCYDNLGLYGKPYWEIYPSADGEPERYAMEDSAGLLMALKKSLRRGY